MGARFHVPGGCSQPHVFLHAHTARMSATQVNQSLQCGTVNNSSEIPCRNTNVACTAQCIRILAVIQRQAACCNDTCIISSIKADCGRHESCCFGQCRRKGYLAKPRQTSTTTCTVFLLRQGSDILMPVATALGQLATTVLPADVISSTELLEAVLPQQQYT